MERIEMIAEQMATKYKDSKCKWLLILKRLETEGYKIVKIHFSSKCSRCQKIYSLNQLLTDSDGKQYCYYCMCIKTTEKGKTSQ